MTGVLAPGDSPAGTMLLALHRDRTRSRTHLRWRDGNRGERAVRGGTTRSVGESECHDHRERECCGRCGEHEARHRPAARRRLPDASQHAGSQGSRRSDLWKRAQQQRLLGIDRGPLPAVGATLQVLPQRCLLRHRQLSPARQHLMHAFVLVHHDVPYNTRNRSRARDNRWRIALPRMPSMAPISSVLKPATSNR